MKYLFSFFMIILFSLDILAQPPLPQNVGIGTSSPHAAALLDLTSTTKGLLLPRMTSAQRSAIPSVPSIRGMVVYDTDIDCLMQSDGLFWRKLLNSSFWNRTNNSNYVYNSVDSVGIGTSSPNAKLEVIGNVKTSARIDAGGVVAADGLNSSGNLTVSGTSLLLGNVVGNGTSSFTGNINSNAGVSITDASGILQFKNGSTEKSYVQLSGDDLRMGTNIGNTTGGITMRLNGNDLIDVKNYLNSGSAQMFLNYNNTPTGLLHATSTGNLSITNVIANKQVQLGSEIYIDVTGSKTGFGHSIPTERVHVNGNVKIEDKLLSANTGTYNMMPLCYARINSSGTVYAGTPNLTSSKSSDHFYTISCPGITVNSVFQVTAHSGAAGFMLGKASYKAPGEAEVSFIELRAVADDPGGFFGAYAAPFFIVIYNP